MALHLLDANVLIALLAPAHEHYEPARKWFTSLTPEDSFATDPIGEGAFIRYSVRSGFDADTATRALAVVHRHPRWVFCANDVSYAELDLGTVRGHKQVTDTYLANLADVHDGVLVTFDRPLATRLPEHARLLTA